ncbi:MAG: response regulator [Anaerolineales bacterium]
MPEQIRVLVADDHSIVRKGIMNIIRDMMPGAIIGQARDGEDALNRCLTEFWDLVILDVTMPKLSGIEVLRQAKRQRPELRVIMCSMHAGPQYEQLSLRLGAMGYVSKAEATEELEPAIRAALQGRGIS